MLFSLRREFGEPLGNGLFSFPNAEILAGVSEKRFRQLGLGYRAGFVKDFSERVCKGEINFGKLQKMKTLDACEALLECKGIGGKVADCILLYGLGKLDVFPVDVWIARIMQKEFGKEMKGKSGEKIRGFAVDRFGNYSGYAQLYLFAMSRKSRGI
jgi:N-glycosylase/DNA lyase